MLRLVESALSEFKQILYSEPENMNDAQILSSDAAFMRLKKISRVQETRIDLSQSLGNGGSSSSATSGAQLGASVRAVSAVMDCASELLNMVPNLTTSTQGHLELTARTLNCNNSIIKKAILEAPSSSLGHAYPGLGMIHAIVPSTVPRHVAITLLKAWQLHDSMACQQLTSALQEHAAVLINMLKGNFPNASILLKLFAAWRHSVAVGGFDKPISVSSVSSDFGEFNDFVSFIVELLSALGFEAHDLLALVTDAASLRKILPQHQKAYDATFIPAVMDSLENFGGIVRVWLSSPSAEPIQKLVPVHTRTRDALKAAHEARVRDVSGLGLNEPIGNSGVSSRQRDQSPFHVDERSHKKPRSNPAARPDTSMTSTHSPCRIKQCSIGKVCHWGKYYHVDHLQTQFSKYFPNVQFRDQFIKCLTCMSNRQDRFSSLVPNDASPAERQALKSWYDARKGQDFVIDAPSDFH